ncbi:hypothetical protein ACJX0J_040934, partial [Zea mays]
WVGEDTKLRARIPCLVCMLAKYSYLVEFTHQSVGVIELNFIDSIYRNGRMNQIIMILHTIGDFDRVHFSTLESLFYIIKFVILSCAIHYEVKNIAVTLILY